jgi:glycosyltransferase involved in cell wall biosynthesis
MKLSILIPAHNEDRTIEKVLKKVMQVNLGKWEREIIVVDDGSTDKTKAILERFPAGLADKKKAVKILYHNKNQGKGAAIRTALLSATGNYVIIQDADLEYDPSDIPKLLSSAKTGVTVFGNRGVKRYPERGFHFVLGAKILTWTVNLLYGRRLYDLYTGYKLIPRKVLSSLRLQSNGFEFEAEVTCKLIKQGVNIIEIPIKYQPRNKVQGKHIGYKDFFKGFWTILKLMFTVS